MAADEGPHRLTHRSRIIDPDGMAAVFENRKPGTRDQPVQRLGERRRADPVVPAGNDQRRHRDAWQFRAQIAPALCEAQASDEPVVVVVVAVAMDVDCRAPVPWLPGSGQVLSRRHP